MGTREMTLTFRYWMDYGAQPTRFVPLWRRVYNAVKRDAPMTAMVWAPNAGNGWPWGMTRSRLSPEDFALLDTNGNGELDHLDDPYAAFYPGDEYVDWVGTSNYHFGSVPPWLDNVLPYPGQFIANLNYGGFYDFYSVSKNKPLMIAETASTYHPESDPGPGELALKQAWWRQTMTNTTFLDQYSNIKLWCLFEFRKIETDLRDWRITNNTEVLEAFKRDFAPVAHRYVFSNYTPPPVRASNGDNGSTKKNDAIQSDTLLPALLFAAGISWYFFS
jgi:hypothetical protein